MMAKRFTTSPEAIRRMSPDIREQLMARSQAAREYINRCINSPEHQQDAELAAFMAIFHPEVPAERVRRMMRNA